MIIICLVDNNIVTVEFEVTAHSGYYRMLQSRLIRFAQILFTQKTRIEKKSICVSYSYHELYGKGHFTKELLGNP